ncbi:MAG: hypothetical protein ACOZCO_06910 [Bacteroidota bacterium]
MTAEKITIIKTVEYPSAIIEFWDNGIVYFRLTDDYEIDVKDSINNSEAMLQNPPVGFKKYLVLVEPGKKTTITKEAREESERSKAHALTQAMAVVSGNLPQRIIVNFIFRFFRKKGMSVKLFSDRDKAIEWLLGFKRI